MKNKGILAGAIGLALSLAVIYGMVYVAGKGWKKSQQ
jgi:hypothetical protein